MADRSANYSPLARSPTSLPPYSATWDAEQAADRISMDKSSQRSRPQTLYDRHVRWVPRIPPSLIPAIRTTKLLGWVQLAAVLLVFFLAVLPLTIFFWYYRHSFSAKVLSCGESFGMPQNATVRGVEALFTLDATWGRFSFSQAKVLDVAWDLVIGRGAQAVVSIINYFVFSDALLRLVDRHPTSFGTFQHVGLNGAAATSMMAVAKDVFRTNSKRSVALFVYILLSMGYVLSLPTVLSAMTGYSSTSVAWLALGNDEQQIVASEEVQSGYTFYNYGNTTLNSICVDYTDVQDVENLDDYRRRDCKQQLAVISDAHPPRPVSPAERHYGQPLGIHCRRRHQRVAGLRWMSVRLSPTLQMLSCLGDYKYPGNNQTYTSRMDDKTRNCRTPRNPLPLSSAHPL